MESLQRFFEYILHVDPGPGRDRDQALFLFGAMANHRPRRVLKIGIETGYLTLALLYALRHSGIGTLVCLQSRLADEDDPRGGPLKQAGVRFEVGPIGPYLARCPAGDFDAVVADTAVGARHLEAIAAGVAPGGLMVFFDVGPDDGGGLQLAGQAHALGLSCQLFGGPSSAERASASGRGPLWVMAPQADPDQRRVGSRGHRGGPEPAQPVKPQEPIYLGLPPAADNFGWGLCSRYLSAELARKIPVRAFDSARPSDPRHRPSWVFHGLTGIALEPLFPGLWGRCNIGYTFFENELTCRSVENAKRFDLVLGGSSWCRDRMVAKGIAHCGVLIQGIDPKRFYPITTPKSADRFVIFSGGKFELRKGQDLVLRAVQVLQEKYPDIVLVNCWCNIWPQSMDTMALSSHIRYERRGGTWAETMNHIYRLNGLDPSRVFTIDLVPNATQRSLYAQTDVGVFANRCEGGTNLVLMEYMACAKPVIASNTSGHTDIVTSDNALLLNDLRDFTIADAGNGFAAKWQEPCLEELIAQIEWAYHHREQTAALGRQAGRDLRRFTWSQSADTLVAFFEQKGFAPKKDRLKGFRPKAEGGQLEDQPAEG
jgi:glycosyltransferase involved in cell wall biosynthesis